MILNLDEARKIDDSVTTEDLLAIESSIREFTNNHFHLPNYQAEIEAVEGGTLTIEGLNLFEKGDIAEIVGSKYFDGFYLVEKSEDNRIELKTDRKLVIDAEEEEPKLFLSRTPETFKAGVRDILSYKQKSTQRQGIKSETIARMSITYESPQDASATFGGLPVYLFDFCEPYIKMRWP